MLRDVTIGQYYAADSAIHRLDSRVKLLGTLVFAVSLFFRRSFVMLLLATVCLAALVIMSKVPLKYMLKGLKPVILLIIFTCVMNLFFVRGQSLIWHWGALSIYKESAFSALYMGARLTEIILCSSLMTYTTTPARLTDGLEKAFSPLQKIHVPVREIALMMSVALRFIPILTDEADRIMKAHAARGVDFDEGNVFCRIKKKGALFMPLFSAAIARAGDLALAMEARCYRVGKERSHMSPLSYTRADIFAYIVIMLYLAATITYSYVLAT